jgi:Tfp pilus assembly protein PilX
VARKAAALRDASAAMQAAGAAFVQKEQQLEEAKGAKVRITDTVAATLSHGMQHT